MLQPLEKSLIEELIRPGGVVFDVGANIGVWTQEVVQKHAEVALHLFEPSPENFHQLLQNCSSALSAGADLRFNNLALSSEVGHGTFFYYEEAPSWSTLFRRKSAESQNLVSSPVQYPVLLTTLDEYCQRNRIRQINFLKIDVEGAELAVLRGCEAMLRRGMIDYVQFEYGGTFLDADTTLKSVFDLFHAHHYGLFELAEGGLLYHAEAPAHETYEYSNFLAVNERFLSRMLGQPGMLDLGELCRKHGISPRGVIHVGAHEGEEMPTYRAMGVGKVLFIEANPSVFQRLSHNLEAEEGVLLENCAISDINGTVELNITSMDQSSSILPLKYHQEIYPEITTVQKLPISAYRLHDLMLERGYEASEFNLLNIDIQGAELLALRGAEQVLPHIDAINTEVNFAELYEGCALIEQLDEFLEQHGFMRVATTTPYHASWGDAFYVKRPAITMSTLGTNGRFANQIFQYAFMRLYAKQHGLRLELPQWIGRQLFGHQDPEISVTLPALNDNPNRLSHALLANTPYPLANIDVQGYFQYHTRYYAPHKAYFRSLFKPLPEIEAGMEAAWRRLNEKGRTIVGLHLRRGDYGYSRFFVAPTAWYVEWLRGFWDTLEDPVLFIASDDLDQVLPDFAEFAPLTSRDLGVDIMGAPYYPDFYLLSKCDAVAISNSSFSFAACMLNERGTIFARPHRFAQKLVPFDPWNSEVLLDHYEEPLPPAPAFPSPACFSPDQLPLELDSERKFLFFHHPEWASRGWEDVLASYLSSFRATDGTCLGLWLDPVQGVVMEEAVNRIGSLIESLGLDPEATPDILLIPDRLQDEEIGGLYAAVDCVVPNGDLLQRNRAIWSKKPYLTDLQPQTWWAMVRGE